MIHRKRERERMSSWIFEFRGTRELSRPSSCANRNLFSNCQTVTTDSLIRCQSFIKRDHDFKGMKFVSWVEKLYEITIINALDEIQTFAPQIKTDGLIFIEIVGLLSQS